MQYKYVFVLTDGDVEDYLEWPRLEAGLAGWDKSLPGEEYGEREEPTRFCPEDDKELFLFSEGDLAGISNFRFRQKHYTLHNTVYVCICMGGVFSEYKIM